LVDTTNRQNAEFMVDLHKVGPPNDS
jgi:hypothetical protein